MNLTKYSLGEYTSLLTTKNLLAAPLPAGLDLSRTVELVSYDSKNVVPGTLFLCKGAHFRPEYLQQAADRGAFAYVSETPYPEVACPASMSPTCARSSPPLQCCTTMTPPGC